MTGDWLGRSICGSSQVGWPQAGEEAQLSDLGPLVLLRFRSCL